MNIISYDFNCQPELTNDLLVEKMLTNLTNLTKLETLDTLDTLDLTQLSLEPIEPSSSNPSKRGSQATQANKIIKKTINIDSRFRDNYYNSKSSNFHIDLPEPLKRVVAMEFTAYNIPISIHTINVTNNYFVIRKNSTNVSTLIDISYGNYNTPCSNRLVDFAARNIETILSQKLMADLSYTMNLISGKSVFTNASSTDSYSLFFNTTNTNNFEFEERPLPLKFGWKLGFRYGEYILKPGDKVTSEGIVDFDSPKYLYACINDFTNAGTNNFIATFSDSIVSKDIIARIDYVHQIDKKNYFNTARNDAIQNASRQYYGPVDIKKLHIKVLDEYGDVVDFNTMDWSFTLQLDLLYD